MSKPKREFTVRVVQQGNARSFWGKPDWQNWEGEIRYGGAIFGFVWGGTEIECLENAEQRISEYRRAKGYEQKARVYLL